MSLHTGRVDVRKACKTSEESKYYHDTHVSDFALYCLNVEYNVLSTTETTPRSCALPARPGGVGGLALIGEEPPECESSLMKTRCAFAMGR